MAESFGDGIGMMTLMIIPRYLGKFLASGYDQLTKGKPWKKSHHAIKIIFGTVNHL